jgi:AbiV family abortive infection protein
VNKPDIVSDALGWQQRGKVLARLGAGIDVMSAMAAEGKSLVTSASESGRRTQWLALSAHVESLWCDAVRALAAGSHAVATFLALTTIEEVGKLAVARLEVVLRHHGVVQEVVPLKTRRHSAFYSHDKKYLVAAASTALVNARMRRLFGEPWVQRLLKDAETGRLARLRNKALYADSADGQLHIPTEVIDSDEAVRYVATAGELLAEVQLDPTEWRRLIADVDAFRSSNPGLVSDPTRPPSLPRRRGETKEKPDTSHD